MYQPAVSCLQFLMTCFFLAAFKNLILSVHLSEFILLGSWNFLDVYVHVIRFGEVGGIISSIFSLFFCLSLLLLGLHYLYVGLPDGKSQVHYTLHFPSVFFFFSLCTSGSIITIVLFSSLLIPLLKNASESL